MGHVINSGINIHIFKGKSSDKIGPILASTFEMSNIPLVKSTKRGRKLKGKDSAEYGKTCPITRYSNSRKRKGSVLGADVPKARCYRASTISPSPSSSGKASIANSTQSESTGESMHKQEVYEKKLAFILKGHNCGDGWRFGEDLIKDTYLSDYKLQALHIRVLEEYQKTKSTLPHLYSMRDKELHLSTAGGSIVSKKSHINNAEILDLRIADLESDATLREFVQMVEAIVTEYISLGMTRHIISFKKTPQLNTAITIEPLGNVSNRPCADSLENNVRWNRTSEKTEYEQKKLELVSRYISLANMYVYLNVTRVVSNANGAQCCFSCMSEVYPSEVSLSGLIVCQHCYAENPVTFSNSLHKEDMTLVHTKDDSISHFEIALKKYSGLQDPPPVYLIDKLNRYMQCNGYPTLTDAADMPLDEYNRKERTSCQILIKALSSIKEVKYYEDVHLIGAMLWGWHLSDLREQKETILQHFRCTQRVFNNMPKEDRGRNSTLGIQFRLYAHLRVIGHKCRFEDFKIPYSPTSLQTHKKNWKYMCQHSGVPELVAMSEMKI